MDSWKTDIGRKIMRTRDAKLSDYDVPKEDEARLDEYCKKLD